MSASARFRSPPHARKLASEARARAAGRAEPDLPEGIENGERAERVTSVEVGLRQIGVGIGPAAASSYLLEIVTPRDSDPGEMPRRLGFGVAPQDSAGRPERFLDFRSAGVKQAEMIERGRPEVVGQIQIRVELSARRLSSRVSRPVEFALAGHRCPREMRLGQSRDRARARGRPPPRRRWPQPSLPPRRRSGDACRRWPSRVRPGPARRSSRAPGHARRPRRPPRVPSSDTRASSARPRRYALVGRSVLGVPAVEPLLLGGVIRTASAPLTRSAIESCRVSRSCRGRS